MSTARTDETKSARRWLVLALCVVFATGPAAGTRTGSRRRAAQDSKASGGGHEQTRLRSP
jgi:hypothetical protein